MSDLFTDAGITVKPRPLVYRRYQIEQVCCWCRKPARLGAGNCSGTGRPGFGSYIEHDTCHRLYGRPTADDNPEYGDTT